MAECYPFDGHNKRFDQEEEGDIGKPPMFTYFNGWVNFSRWRLSPEEIAEINRTGEIVVGTLTGKAPMHQTFVGSFLNVREAAIDFGRPLTKLPHDAASIIAFNRA